VLVFAFIYSGVPNWAAADGVVTLVPASGPQVEVRLDEPDSRSVMCAIALLDNTGGEISVRREVRYVQGGHKALDDAYGWGLRWAAGRK
jgi:tellurite resistance protein TerA